MSKAISETTLKPGSFYWVRPVFDVDFNPPGFGGLEHSNELFDAACDHWTQKEQPARFDGWTDDGQEKWIYLGQEVDQENWWPTCWVGDEISADRARGVENIL